jgi:tetratricopeptide (TPR) repeat protein
MDCEKLHAFADGELPAAEVPAFKEHLGACPACQSELRDVMALEALWLGLAQTRRSSWTHAVVEVTPTGAATPVRSGRRAPPWAWKAGLAAVAASVLVAFTARRNGRQPEEALADARPFAARVVSQLANQHRPLRLMRGAPGAERPRLETLAQLEASGDEPELGAVYLLAGSLDQAELHLRRGPPSAAVANNRAVLAMQRGRWEEARALLLAVLAAIPDHRQARWNLALLYQETGDRGAAAAGFDALAADGEPGWSSEAAARARDLRQDPR